MPKQSYLPYFDQLSETGQPLWVKFFDFFDKDKGDSQRDKTQFQYNPSNDSGGGMKMKVVK